MPGPSSTSAATSWSWPRGEATRSNGTASGRRAERRRGMGLGATEAALVLEEIGRNLTPSPFLTTGIVAAKAIACTAHADRWYPGILSGDAVLALAIDEGPRHAPERTTLEAKRQ